tara:strand:- start:258 stop:1355 length:1098 start_codon:yes stop_codon:yes gene_type:complete
MKSYLLLKYFRTNLKEYIFIFLTTSIFLFIPFTKSFGEENVFTISNVEVEGRIDLNFSREKYLNIAFLDSFQILMNKILLTRDLEKINNIKLNQIKNLIKSFQLLDESYKEDIYRANITIIYNEAKIKDFLGEKNISFSNPENISAVFFPLLYINGEIQDLSENFFYRQWEKIEIKNELINFVLPLEDLEDISKITEMKDKIEKLNVDLLVNKYDIKNYVFALIDYKDQNLNIHLKTNFNNNKVYKNISYKIENIKDELVLNSILKDLKLKITDLWKEENLINLLMPLSIKIKFQHSNIKDLEKMKNTFYKISIINNYTLEKFNINNSFFKIYYYGNPKKLRTELLKFGYLLKNNQGFWEVYLNE